VTDAHARAGKTALHWAAAVNNVDALTILLQHDANKDAQDCHDQTPLFLAAREGSCEAVKQLLEHGANRDIADHMDRLPRHVAHERMHRDIVSLLDDYDPTGRRFHVSSSDGVMSTACFMGKGKQKKASAKRSSGVMSQGRGHRMDPGASACLLPSGGSPQSAQPQVHAARSKVAAESMGSSAMMPLLDVRELVSASGGSGANFELPPSYETACSETPVHQQGAYLPEATVSTISCGMQQMAAAAGRSDIGRKQRQQSMCGASDIYQNISPTGSTDQSGFEFDNAASRQPMTSGSQASDWLSSLDVSHLTKGNHSSLMGQQFQAVHSVGVRPSLQHQATYAKMMPPTSCAAPPPPPSRKNSLTLSPHVQALQQQQHVAHMLRNAQASAAGTVSRHVDSATSFHQHDAAGWSHQPGQRQHHRLHHYPTPPSQHGTLFYSPDGCQVLAQPARPAPPLRRVRMPAVATRRRCLTRTTSC
jgi:hypothetical protein